MGIVLLLWSKKQRTDCCIGDFLTNTAAWLPYGYERKELVSIGRIPIHRLLFCCRKLTALFLTLAYILMH